MPDWLRRRLPEWLTAWWPQWLHLSNAALWWITGASAAAFLVTAAAVPGILVYLPADYFTRPRRRAIDRVRQRPLITGPLLVGKNLVGAALLIVGLAMLVLPGQGVLTILVAVLLLDFPRKYRVERWLVTRPRLFGGVNWLRRKAGRAPLQQPPGEDAHAPRDSPGE